MCPATWTKYNVRVEPRSNNAPDAGLSSFQSATLDSDAAKATDRKLRPKGRPPATDFVSEVELDRLLGAWLATSPADYVHIADASTLRE